MDAPETIASISDLEVIATKTNADFGEAIWWRGHSDRDWTLKASIWRPKHAGFAGNEIAFINHFQGRAICQQESRRLPQDEVEWLLLAQHYRLPTRLLDWTESPLVALYFAVTPDDADRETADKDACLWALSPTKLNQEFSNPMDPNNRQDGLVSVKESIVQGIVSASFGVKQTEALKAAFPKVLALQPWESNERIIAQTGRFTLHSSQDAIETLAFGRAYLKRVIIPREAKEVLRRRLDVFGVRRWSIFPDLENLAKGLSGSGFNH
jgi:hypothetical protein